MNKLQTTFEQFLAATSVQIPVFTFIINLLLAALLAVILGKIYVLYGHSLSNRKALGRNFIMITMTTMLIISIVKASLALSLGLVGALSIVRFRAAIKEPEELAYLFLAIGVGLGFGADQAKITIIAFIIITAVLVMKSKLAGDSEDNNRNLHVTIYSHNPQKAGLDEIIEVLKRYCKGINLKRFDEQKEFLDATFQVEFNDSTGLNDAKSELLALNDSVKISFLDNRGVIS